MIGAVNCVSMWVRRQACSATGDVERRADSLAADEQEFSIGCNRERKQMGHDPLAPKRLSIRSRRTGDRAGAAGKDHHGAIEGEGRQEVCRLLYALRSGIRSVGDDRRWGMVALHVKDS
jgi:hypothetical protein